jgi:hypothetical protein
MHLVTLWEEETIFNLQPSLQLLEDVHRCFFYHGFPDRLSTADLLQWMHALPARPWDGMLSLSGVKKDVKNGNGSGEIAPQKGEISRRPSRTGVKIRPQPISGNVFSTLRSQA